MLESNETLDQQSFEYMSESKAKDLVKTIKPIQRYHNVPYLIENLSNLDMILFFPYSWYTKSLNSKTGPNNFIITKEIKYTKLDMTKVEIIEDIEMFSQYYFDGKISPTLHEIFSQIPYEHLDKVIAFEIIKKDGSILYFNPKFYEKNGEANYCIRHTDLYRFNIRIYSNKK